MNENKLLIIVDMQNDFLTGSLANKSAVGIIPTIIDEIQTSNYILLTRDTHSNSKEYLVSQEGKNLPIPHCQEGTIGWEVESTIMSAVLNSGIPYAIVDKHFFGMYDLHRHIDDAMKELGIFAFDEIELVGTCTDICVVSNALILKASMPEIPISVRQTACAGLTEEKHNAAIEVMKSCQVIIKD